MSVEHGLPDNRVLMVVVALLAGFGVACVAHRPPSEAIEGWLLPGPHAAAALGIEAEHRLAEAPESGISLEVREGARSVAMRHDRPAKCIRYFPTRTVVVVVVPAFCDASIGRETEGRIMAALDSSGRLRGELFWRPAPGVATLVPFDRFSRDE